MSEDDLPLAIMSTSEPFPFARLSVELALEIISYAAYPQPTSVRLDCPRPNYSTARALASTSQLMYHMSMPHLLHTVALNTTAHLQSFIWSLHLQRHRKQYNSRLMLDYTKLVRRFWATGVWESLVEQSPEDTIDYRALWDIIQGVDCLGLSFHSSHLLYNGVGSAAMDSSVDWSCRQLVLSGIHWRWSPLTSSNESLAFLRQITHLALWIPYHGEGQSSTEQSLPYWIRSVPFALMPNLAFFAFPLLDEASGPIYEGTVVCTTSRSGKNDFLEWATSGELQGETIRVAFESSPVLAGADDDAVWDYGYVQRESVRAWDIAARQREWKEDAMIL